MTQHICSKDLRSRSSWWCRATRRFFKNCWLKFMTLYCCFHVVGVAQYLYDMRNINIQHCVVVRVVVVVLFKCYWFPIREIVVVIATRVLYTETSEWGDKCPPGPGISQQVRVHHPTPSRSEWRSNLYGRIICLISERQIAVITRLHAMNESTTYLCRIGLQRAKYTLTLHNSPTSDRPNHPSW